MPTTSVRKNAKASKAAPKAEKTSKRSGKTAIPKHDKYWYYIPLESGGYQPICRPRGKTSVPLAVIRKAVRAVIAERTAKKTKTDEGQHD